MTETNAKQNKHKQTKTYIYLFATNLKPSSKIPKLDLKIQIKCPPKPRSGHLPMKRRDIKSKLVVCPKACQRFITPARSLEGHIWRA